MTDRKMIQLSEHSESILLPMKIMAITTDLLSNGMYRCARTAVNFKDIQDNKAH